MKKRLLSLALCLLLGLSLVVMFSDVSKLLR